ncbi:MAG: 50S ribosomal protein L33 [Rickettsiales bacterium]|jgi:large subunit ribosomal protein L33|nr:50S ribosomal protein L33 [Rickettsiales bacterium]
MVEKTAKKKRASIILKLVSTADTGYYYVTRKNPKKKPKKMEFCKYDPVVRKHVLFKEAKLV